MFANWLENLAGLGVGSVVLALLEVLLFSFLLYHVLLAVRGTRAAQVVLGFVLLGALYYASGALGLTTAHWVMGGIKPYVILALIVIFQTEIRRTLRQIALSLVPSTRPGGAVRHEYEDVIFAVSHLSQDKVGALIVLERETGLRTFVQSGVALEARLSSDLLVSIFQRSSPLHDGAVIIQRGTVVAGACFLPLTTNPELISSLGTRHRAGIGITEESDCMAIIVAETTGRISIAAGGAIELGVSLDRLRLRLIDHFGPVVVPPRGKDYFSRETAAASAASSPQPPAGSSEAARTGAGGKQPW